MKEREKDQEKHCGPQKKSLENHGVGIIQAKTHGVEDELLFMYVWSGLRNQVLFIVN